MTKKGDIGATIARIASRQWGFVRRAQLLEAGLAPRTITSRIRAGVLFPEHAGVYALGYRRIEPVARSAAAVLAGHPDAALSHDSAAALWELRRWPLIPEISCPRSIRRPGIRSHRGRDAAPDEITTQLGIRTMTAARALRDISPRLTPRQRTRLANEARLRRLISADEAAALRGHPRNPTRSGGEDLLQELLEIHDLPQPQTNVVVCGFEADAWFAAERVVVEVDHIATHGDPRAFAEDRRRDAIRAAAGILTVRLLTEDLIADPDGQMLRLKEILEARRPPGRSS